MRFYIDVELADTEPELEPVLAGEEGDVVVTALEVPDDVIPEVAPDPDVPSAAAVGPLIGGVEEQDVIPANGIGLQPGRADSGPSTSSCTTRSILQDLEASRLTCWANGGHPSTF